MQIIRFKIRNVENDKILVLAFIRNNLKFQNIEKHNLIIEINKIAEILVNTKQED